MKSIQFRIVKTEGKTKEGRKFPRYYAIYVRNGERAYIDVSFTGDTLKAFLGYLDSHKASYLDVSLPFAEKKEERENQHAFVAPKRKINVDGTYSYITDRKGNRIPHIVITKLNKDDILVGGIKLPESRTEKKYEVDNFFKGATAKDIDDYSDLPF